jgi:hypothetical protein
MRVQITFDVPEVPGLQQGVRRGGPRRFLVIAALVALLAVPTGVFANHLFTDVPNSNTFHGNISALAEAGITSGCSPTTFCPAEPVTRGQMAAFLQRGLTRVARGDVPPTAVGTTTQAPLGSPVSITPGISPGAIDGAAQFLQATATGTIYLTDATGCPCVFRMNIREGASNYLNTRVVQVTLRNEGDYVPMSVTGAGLVTGSSAKNVQLILYRLSGSGSASAFATVVVSTAPYSGQGNNTLPSSVAGGDDDGTAAGAD